ncbi:MAG: ABC transporter ATP-binding protein [Pseudolabrys sp.]|nr:ABC transporter ATP-binding protein [Pseudolabrys sp.]
MTILQVTQLSGGYNKADVLHDVSIAVGKGEIVTIVGANGAGKSTLLGAIVGMLPRTRGDIVYDGRSIRETTTDRIVRQGTSLVPERRQLFGSMTVLENLLLGAFGIRDRTLIERRIDEQFRRFPILQERRSQAAQMLSGGQQQMLAIARGLMSAPKLLLLDEPSLGLAPLIVQQVLDEIRKLRDEGATVLLVEQNAVAALRIADRAYVMSGGRVVDDRPPQVLLADQAFAQAYLGGGEGDSMESRIRAKADESRRATVGGVQPEK